MKVYNLGNINYVEMVHAMGLKSIPEKQNEIVSGRMSGCSRQRMVISLVVIHFHLLKRKALLKYFNLIFFKLFPTKKSIELEVILILGIAAVSSGYCVAEPCRIFLEHISSTYAGLS